jgi:hypothetical protein
MPDEFHLAGVEIQDHLHIQQLKITPAGFLAHLAARCLLRWFTFPDASGDWLPIGWMLAGHCVLEQQEHCWWLLTGDQPDFHGIVNFAHLDRSR